MKKFLIFSLFAILFSGSFAQVHDDVILLKPETGYQYIYEYTDSFYALSDENSRIKPFFKRKLLKIRYDKFQPEGKDHLLVTVEKNIAEKQIYRLGFG